MATLVDSLKCESIEEIENLTDNISESYRARIFIIIPPCLMHPIHSAISVYQKNVERGLIGCNQFNNFFDSLHEDDNEYKEKLHLNVNLYCYSYIYITIRAIEIEGVYKVPSEPCFNADLVNLLKKVESNYLNQSTDSQISISQVFFDFFLNRERKIWDCFYFVDWITSSIWCFVCFSRNIG